MPRERTPVTGGGADLPVGSGQVSRTQASRPWPVELIRQTVRNVFVHWWFVAGTFAGVGIIGLGGGFR